MLIDVNCSYGPWPFAPCGCETLAELDQHLASHGIDHALVSSLRAVFYPDPRAANLFLLAEAASFPRIQPVPTLNAQLAGNLRQLDDYRKRTPIAAVKLYPNYHHYRLDSRRCSELLAYLESHDIPALLNARLEDERFLYRGLTLPRVTPSQIASAINRFPKLRVVCLGLTFEEIIELSHLAPRFATDMAFADGHDLIPKLLEFLEPTQLLFGSHTPLMVTEANRLKLATAPISEALKTQIAHDNPAHLFNLEN